MSLSLANQSKTKVHDRCNTKQIGLSALMLAFLSFFIFSSAMSISAIIVGSLGLYKAVSSKDGIYHILLNALAILLGVIIQIFSALFL